jgi:hypothetical protein
MFKSSKFFRITLVSIALVICNYSELRAQEAWIYADAPYYAEMTWNAPDFTYTGYISGAVYFYFNDVPGALSYEGNFSSFPSGNIYPCCGNPVIIPSGYYVLTFNPVSGTYAFGNATSCYGSSNTPVLSIYDYTIYNGYSFCEPAELYADFMVNGENIGIFYSGLEYQWLLNGEPILGAVNYDLYSVYPSATETDIISLIATCPINNDTLYSNELVYPLINVDLQIARNAEQPYCAPEDLFGTLFINDDSYGAFDIPYGVDYQWLRNGTPVSDATNINLLDVIPSSSEEITYSLIATCEFNNDTVISNELSIPTCYYDFNSSLNYLLLQNVTTTGNIPGQSVQVQFDLNWGNTWRDDVNWDAAWVFMKYKDANGVWQHAKVSPTGFDHGEGTPNLIEPTADQMGAFVRLAVEGQGNFNAEGMQLRWNYGADGLSSVSGLEVRVFAIEMVYHPQGDFSMSFDASAPGGKFPVINSRLTPALYVNGVNNVRIKGDAGLDLDANGVVDNTTYPTGYYPFYLFKYEMSEQQYADFLNCLTPTQRMTLGVAGNFITQNGDQYFSSRPNAVCLGSNQQRLMAYADWCGLRPMSFMEFQKAYNGPKPPRTFLYYGWEFGECGGNPIPDVTTLPDLGAGVYGSKSLSIKAREPFVPISASAFNRTTHGNGVLDSSGLTNETNWQTAGISWLDPYNGEEGCAYGNGFRLCRTAE